MDEKENYSLSRPRLKLASHPTVDVALGCLSNLKCSSSPKKTDEENSEYNHSMSVDASAFFKSLTET